MRFQSPYFSQIAKDKLDEYKGVVTKYLPALNKGANDYDYETMECTLALPSDERVLHDVIELTQQVITPHLKYHILVGIGGSYFGSKAIYDAKHGFFDTSMPKRFPKMLFIDTCDPKGLATLHEFINTYTNQPNEVLITAVTKSGATTETIVNLEIILELFPNIHEQLVLISGENSKLTKIAETKDIHHLTIPINVGGRYSVMSAVGLFPLVTMGVEISKLREGAEAMLQVCLADELENNPAFISAATLYHYSTHGHNIHDTFLFHPELESLGKWYRQLMGESIGKSIDLDGNEVHAGMTPTVSVGTSDLHSVGQLYLGGPHDKVTTFVSTTRDETDINVPTTLKFPGIVTDIEGQSASTIMHSILKGVQKTYDNQKLPYMNVELETINEYELGAFMQFKMVEMMMLARLLNVNAFNQPNVESYKEETRRILKQL